jgi:hypothetical protein
MGKRGNEKREKAGQPGASRSTDWREPLFEFPLLLIPSIVPLLLLAFISVCYMVVAYLAFGHHLSAFEVHFILILMILTVIFTGFLSVVQRRAYGRRGAVRGAPAVWAGVIVMLFGILLLLYYLAVVVGLL